MSISILDPDLVQSLQGATAEMKTDKFFRDLAQPIDMALRYVKDEAAAYDKVSAKHARSEAVRFFEASAAELDKAAASNMFVRESKLVHAALAALKLEGDDAVQEAVAEAEAAPKFTAEVKQPVAFDEANEKLGVKKEAPPVATGFDEAAAKAKPFTWDQDEEEGMVTIRIPVPGECTKHDVKVTFLPEHLTVSVANHPLQPTVVDTDLLYTVRSGECSWALEGKGGKRTLALSLEKAYSDQKWVQVVADDEGRKKKGLSDAVAGVEGLQAYTPELH